VLPDSRTTPGPRELATRGDRPFDITQQSSKAGKKKKKKRRQQERARAAQIVSV
jgi:hypothetical protein